MPYHIVLDAHSDQTQPFPLFIELEKDGKSVRMPCEKDSTGHWRIELPDGEPVAKALRKLLSLNRTQGVTDEEYLAAEAEAEKALANFGDI